MNIRQLMEMVEDMFSRRLSYMTLLQEISEHFYPQRADFTLRRNFDDDYAADLMTSYPVLIRRDLADQIGQMLRPTATEWFKIIPKGGEETDHEGRVWLEEMTRRMRLAMYAKPAKFNRAMKQADHDFATFGQDIVSCRLNRNNDNLLYRNWHIRDCAWHENEEGDIGIFARKWKPTARDLKVLFGSKVDDRVNHIYEKRPLDTIKCYHIVIEADMYDSANLGRPFFSIYYDAQHEHVMEETPVFFNEYTVPRWETVSGSQYAFSPATITALPDARLLQAMTFTLLEAGEKATNPPIIATQDVVRSDMALYAGGYTWVDKEYDERLGAAMRPMPIDIKGIPLGQDMITDSRMMLAECFYLNKLTLPERAPEMTAYEVGQRVQEYIRGALPIFEPMEDERNAAECMLTFKVLLRAGVFGSPRDIPAQLFNDGIDFEFQSPLHDAIEEQKGQKLLEAKALAVEMIDIDRGAGYLLDAREALRDALTGVGIPAKWMHDEEEVEEMVQDAAAAEEEQVRLEQLLQGSEAAKNISEAGQQLEIV